MLGIKKIIEYLHNTDEVKSFEECFEVEFPEDVSLEEQIQFVKGVEDEEHVNPIEMDEKETRHILYYLLLAQLELSNLKPSTIVLENYHLIGDEIFLNDDENEENPINLYTDIPEDDAEDGSEVKLYALGKDGSVRIFQFTKSLTIIKVHHRWEILNYCLGEVTEDDQVTMKDIFMHGKYVKEVGN